MPRNRAFRRAQEERAKTRVKEQTRQHPHIEGHSPLHLDEEWVARQASTRARCSCWMCGNPRKIWGVTHKERLSELDEREQLEYLKEKRNG